jgi:DNA polymerase-3 subunit gamma/tau
MSYQVIARKYRPQRFADVVGQDHIVQTLSNAIAQNRIAHAYIFCGPRGTGKTTLARIFAKALNCTQGPTADFDDTDPRCQEITEGRSLDVLEIDGASNNGVEQVRELRDTVKFAPACSRFKIYIIDEVHMLSTAAFNALLKTLEEPPSHVKFMFATTDPEKVLPTILSRCQRFDLRRIPSALIVKHLGLIAGKEGVDADAGALHAIARGADGGMRDAESALDQLISFCGRKLEEADVLQMFGLTSQHQILSVALAILKGDAPAVIREVDALSRSGKDLSRLLGDILGHFRNLLVYQVSGGDLSLLEVSEAEAEALRQHGSSAGVDALTRMMEVLSESDAGIRDASSKKIFLEVALMKTLQARNTVSLDTVLQQLRQLRAGGPAASPAAAPRAAAVPAPPLASAAASTPVQEVKAREIPASEPAKGPSAEGEPAPARAAEPGGPAALEGLWRQLLEAVGRVSQFTRSYLMEAFPASFTGNLFTIGFDPEFGDHIDLVNNTKNIELLQTKLRELGHPNVYVKFVKATAPDTWSRNGESPAAAPPAAPSPVPSSRPQPPPASSPPAGSAKPAAPPAAELPKAAPVQLDPSEFKNDPLIAKALEIFRGRIVEVRA